ncbi:MAG: amidophosphoribosyltransferase [Clostridiales bacterium]|jgi:amidophosphoribosyltransferase|nr:amidophosphoribosyltransferase [Clostridiales bacterium]
MSKPREECGVFGIIAPKPFKAAAVAATALLALQHRGQEGAGIAYFDDSQTTYFTEPQLVCRKGLGLVADIFTKDELAAVPETLSASGHVRYSTTGINNVENTQPIATTHSKVTFALSHNGNITNAAFLRDKMIRSGKVFHTTNDSEVLNKLIIDAVVAGADFFDAVFNLLNVCEGAYSIVILTKDKLYALRDKNGFRPLCTGKAGGATAFASESCALDAIGAEFTRDVLPGELVCADGTGIVKTKRHNCKDAKRGLCVFEFVYFARPDSFIDGISVHTARIEMGRALARQRKTDADIVCGVPDSGLDAAFGYHMESGLEYGQAFVKNRYVGRSFIAPDQLSRDNIVLTKLNPLRVSVAGKRVVLVDDSIVRGTTSAKIIAALKRAGASEVHMRISSPPFTHECHFGTDIDSKDNLIACRCNVEQIRERIGADSLEYLSLENLCSLNGGKPGFCAGCFTGDYPVGVAETKKDKFDDWKN